MPRSTPPDVFVHEQRPLTPHRTKPGRPIDFLEALEHHVVARLRRMLSGATERQPIPPPAAGGVRLDGVIQDVRYGLRLLRREPGYAAVAMLVMAIGIGATTMLFSV